MINEIDGIIYKVLPYKESSRLLYVITTQGKKTLIAAGVQKTNNINRLLAQYLTKISFNNRIDRSMFYLANPVLINDYEKSIKYEFQLLKNVSIVFEAIDRLLYFDIDYNYQAIYLELDKYLSSKPTQIKTYSFLIKFLRFLGLTPNLIGDGREVTGFTIETSSLSYVNELVMTDLDVKGTITLLELAYKEYDDLIDYTVEQEKTMLDFIFKYYYYHLQMTFRTL